MLGVARMWYRSPRGVEHGDWPPHRSEEASLAMPRAGLRAVRWVGVETTSAALRDDLGHRQDRVARVTRVPDGADRLLIRLDERLAGPIRRRGAADRTDDGTGLHSHEQDAGVAMPAREPVRVVGDHEGCDIGRVLGLEF